MKTVIEKLENIFTTENPSGYRPTSLERTTRRNYIAVKRALFVLAHEIDELKDIK